MADLEKAVRALRNAHEAGDMESARRIATAIKKVQAAEGPLPEREEIGDTGGMAGHVTQGALYGYGDEYMAGLSAVFGVQPDGQGGANWFQYDKPIGELYDTALGAIRDEMGQYREENPGKALASQVAGGVGTAVGGAMALPARGAVASTRLGRAAQAITPKAATTVPGRAAQMAGGGAVGGAVEGYGSGEGGVANRAKSAAGGAVAGAIFAPLVGYGVGKIGREAQRIGGGALRRLFTSRQMFNRETGELTERGVSRLRELGYDANELSREMQKSFGIAAERLEAQSAGPETAIATARIAQADRFGVPLTRGQATGDVTQSATEESMRAGVRGQFAQNTLEAFDRTQEGAVDTARAGIGDSLGQNTGNRVDAADTVMTGVRREAESARQAGRQAYEALEQSGAAISGESIGPLRQQIQSAVRAEGFSIDDATPNARAGLNLIEDAFQRSESGAVPFMEIERVRQRLNGLRQAASRGSNGADQVAVGAVMDQFDTFLDDTITDALISGNKNILDEAKNARGLWSRYKNTFLSREGADNFIRKIVQEDLSEDQVASWLFGASNNVGGGRTSLVARRVKDILGEDSPEFGAVRRAAWEHITTPVEGKSKGPQAIASQISELLDGKGQTLSRVLYTDRERQAMGEFRNMLRLLEPPQKATNRSGSGYQVERGMQTLLQGFAGLVGSGAGGPVAGAGAAGAVSFGNSFSGALQARAAAQGITFPATSVPAAVGAGVAAGSQAQERYTR